MNRRSIIVGIAVLGLLLMAWGLWFVFFKPHRSVDRAAVIAMRADSLYLQFQRDENAANRAFLDKALEVSGNVINVSKNQSGQQVVTLDSGDPMGGVTCTLTDPVSGLTTGQAVKIRGFCSGFLNDVILRDAKIKNP